MSFKFSKTFIEDVIIVEPLVHGDNRGFFVETYKKSEFVENGIKDDFVQDNHSKSTKGVLRGLHYQLNPKPQSKLVRCTNGKVLDVAVDIRKGSKTFGKWVSEELSEENKKMLYIPEGFAHGFVVLSDEAELLYKTSNEYSHELDRGIKWDDPDIAVDWGIDFEPTISNKDKVQPLFKDVKEEELL